MKRRTASIASMAVVLFTLGGAAVAAETAHHWTYSGETGPGKWAKLEHDFATCGLGKTQSPIDIRDAAVKKADLPAIQFDYKPSPLMIVDNGHTIQVNVAPGSAIMVDGRKYELLQFHFHKPSEEKINGKPFDMVAHLVHKDADGKLGVVAVLLKGGTDNPLIGTVWKNLPKQNSEAKLDAVSINVADLLPANRNYYTFKGSLTTPPCSEDVTWFVLRTPSSVSGAQVAQFGKRYAMNARPVQPLNGREIRASP